MATETLRLRHYGFGESKPDQTITVEYREATERLGYRETHRGTPLKSYTVWIAGQLAGQLDQSVENTDRKIGRLRSPGRGRVAWSWLNVSSGARNGAGLYARTRRDAVAKMLGYSTGEKVAR